MSGSKPCFIDLSHRFEHGMPGFKLQNPDGSYTQYTAHIRPFFSHQESLPLYQGQSCFEVTEISFQTSVGTYLDSPYHRFADGRDISELKLEELILPGVVIDARGQSAFTAVGREVIPTELDLRDKAVLFNFGWDRYWGSEEYQRYPFIAREIIDYLLDAGVGLVGVDTVNADDSRDLARPAHTLLLRQEIFIVENLTGLERLHEKDFRFFAVPIKAKDTAAMPIRAFAEVM